MCNVDNYGRYLSFFGLFPFGLFDQFFFCECTNNNPLPFDIYCDLQGCKIKINFKNSKTLVGVGAHRGARYL